MRCIEYVVIVRSCSCSWESIGVMTSLAWRCSSPDGARRALYRQAFVVAARRGHRVLAYTQAQQAALRDAVLDQMNPTLRALGKLIADGELRFLDVMETISAWLVDAAFAAELANS